MKNIYKNHILDLLFAILSLAAGILLIPAFGIGGKILDFVVAAALLVYLFTFLVKKLTSSKGTILVLTVVEFIVILLIALGLVLKSLKFLPIEQTCVIIGLVLWLRGTVCLVRGYLITTPEARRKYSLLLFLGYIAMVTIGTWIAVKPIISDEALVIMLCVIAFLLFALFLALAIKFWPKSKKKKKESGENTSSTQKETDGNTKNNKSRSKGEKKKNS